MTNFRAFSSTDELADSLPAAIPTAQETALRRTDVLLRWNATSLKANRAPIALFSAAALAACAAAELAIFRLDAFLDASDAFFVTASISHIELVKFRADSVTQGKTAKC